MDKFNSRPSARYKAAVKALSELVEAEGLGMAYCASAAATSDPMRDDWIKHCGLTETRGDPDWMRLCGRASSWGNRMLPGEDHSSLYMRGRRAEVMVTQPYGIQFGCLGDLVDTCRKHRLRADISAESWYFPMRTIRIDVRREAEPVNDFETPTTTI